MQPMLGSLGPSSSYSNKRKLDAIQNIYLATFSRNSINYLLLTIQTFHIYQLWQLKSYEDINLQSSQQIRENKLRVCDGRETCSLTCFASKPILLSLFYKDILGFSIWNSLITSYIVRYFSREYENNLESKELSMLLLISKHVIFLRSCLICCFRF